jgi:putative inorganic carbon (HCO3(-)) transporter
VGPAIGVTGPKMLFFSTMSNRNVFSSYLCLVLPVAVVLFVKSRNKKRFWLLPLIGLNGYAFLLANTRSGYIGLLVGFLLLLPFIAKDKPSKPFRRGWFIGLAVLLVAGWLILPVAAEKSGSKTLHEISEISRLRLSDKAGSNRGYVWKNSLSVVPEHLLLGFGPDGFHRVFEQRFNAECRERFGMAFDKAHNEYLQVLVDAGVLGLLALLAFYGLLFWSVRKKLDNPCVLAVVAALLCFSIQAFFNINTPFAHPVAWVLWGLLGAGQHPARGSSS